MLRLGSFPAALHGRVNRRSFLTAAAPAPAPLACGFDPTRALAAAPRAKSVLVLWLWGAPSHLDTFDPKPAAPAEYRGPFSTITTRTPGVRFTELFPQLAARSDQLALIRSHKTFDGDHLKAGTIGLTGGAEAT